MSPIRWTVYPNSYKIHPPITGELSNAFCATSPAPWTGASQSLLAGLQPYMPSPMRIGPAIGTILSLPRVTLFTLAAHLYPGAPGNRRRWPGLRQKRNIELSPIPLRRYYGCYPYSTSSNTKLASLQYTVTTWEQLVFHPIPYFTPEWSTWPLHITLYVKMSKTGYSELLMSPPAINWPMSWPRRSIDLSLNPTSPSSDFSAGRPICGGVLRIK